MLSLKRDALIALLISALSSCGGETAPKIENQEKWFYEHVGELSEVVKNIEDTKLSWIPASDSDLSTYSKKDMLLYSEIMAIVEKNGAKSARIINDCNYDNSRCWISGFAIRTRVDEGGRTPIYDLRYVLPDYIEDEQTSLRIFNCKELNVPNWYSCVFNRD